MYCTNCGAESSKKICQKCGVERDKTHLYCKWCGNEIKERATICVSCGEKVKKTGVDRFVSLIFGLVTLLLIAYTAITVITGDYVATAILVVGIIILLPFVKEIIRKNTIGKNGLRIGLNIARIFIVVVLFFLAQNFIEATEGGVDAIATEKYAEIVFHENVKLKNEESFVLNDIEVITIEDYPSDENKKYVVVSIDYSAENGFGGTNREEYIVELICDTKTDQFYRMDGSLIE